MSNMFMRTSRRRFLHRLGVLFAAQPLGAQVAAERRVVCFGDSLTSGHGLEDAQLQAYPALLGAKLAKSPGGWKVVNAGLSGETTAGGLRRVDWVLRQPVDIFLLALGGNDGLRGLPAAVTKGNLEGIIRKVRAKHPTATLVVAGMKMPPSMGRYAEEFARIFKELWEADMALVKVEFLLEGVGGVAAMNQPDQIHPNAAGHRAIADHVWKTLEGLVAK